MSSAIGVFDSGVGGLTVLKSLRLAFPKQNFIYLGDTARLPYGGKSAETIRAYTLQTIRFLLERDVQAVVVACNSASAQIVEDSINGFPIYNVIDPGVTAALESTQNGRLGLLGTRATIDSEAYQARLAAKAKKRGRQINVYAQACPLLVPLAEEGWTQDPITNLIVYRYLHPLLLNEIDTLILGCTHYPILRTSIEKAAGRAVNLVDSGSALAEILRQDFNSGRLKPGTNRDLKLLMTDLSSRAKKWAQEILSEPEGLDIELVNLI